MNHTLAVIVTLLYIVIVATLVIKKYNSVFVFLVSGMIDPAAIGNLRRRIDHGG